LRSSAVALAAVLALLAGGAAADPPFGFGRPATPQDIAAANIDVHPDGTGLPPGRGSVEQGAELYASTCAACHGEKGEKPLSSLLRLVGGQGTLATAKAVETVGSYWPYATTLFDYIRRTMPFSAPQSLTSDQIYAVTAYLLYLNGIVPAGAVLDATTLPQVKMPNRDGFVSAYQPGTGPGH
jgi:mono/diheme cytochrome c family protein